MSEASALPGALHGDPGAPARLLLLHGFMGARDDWREKISGLGPGAACLAVDLPGHGEAAGVRVPEAAGMAAVAERLAKSLDRTGWDRAIVAGYSMGGRIAAYFAGKFPGRVAALALESASLGLATEDERRARQARDEALARRLAEEPLERFVTDWYSQPLFAPMAGHGERFKALMARRCANDPAGLAHALRALGLGAQPDLRGAWRESAAPALLITGARDEKFAAIARDMAAARPGAAWANVPGCGHNVHWEDPAEYTRLLRAFIEDHA